MNRYKTTGTRVVEDKQIKQTTVYPELPLSEQDYYVITTTGDRLDILAKQFYNNQTYWWAIAAANPNIRRDTLFVEPGAQLRIPPLVTILDRYEQLNRTR
jgi:nucleoid-associated protein YgaU